jgi:hypothetical protein
MDMTLFPATGVLDRRGVGGHWKHHWSMCQTFRGNKAAIGTPHMHAHLHLPEHLRSRYQNPLPWNTMMRIGRKPLIMSTYCSDVGNSMNMGTSS